jgi:uroporphyrinogen decarboxylase
MNSAERIMATLAGKSLDRRAFIPVLSLYGARLSDCPLEKYYSDPAAYATGQLAVYREFAPDILLSPFAFALIGSAFGSEIQFSVGQAPNIRKPAIAFLEEWDHLPLPDPDDNSRLLYLRHAIRIMADMLQGDAPIAACLPSPIDIPALIMGMEGWLELVLFDKEGTQRVLQRANQFFVQTANCLFMEGAALMVLPCGYASPKIMMREPVESLMRPALMDALGQLNGPSVLHNAGTDMLRHLDLLVGLPSAVGYALDYREGLAEARRVTGNDPTLLSGPHGPSLADMGAAQVEGICRAILEERKQEKDLHFILATLGADIPLNTPPENIHAMREAVLSAGWGIP